MAASVTEATASPKVHHAFQPAPLDLRVPVKGASLLTVAPKPGIQDNTDAHHVTKLAYRMIGIPYRWGGMSPKRGFDCSGLVNYVFKDVDEVDLPRTARAIFNQKGNPRVDRDKLQPGDLVFFRIRSRSVDHIGIYVGNDQFIHAPRRGKNVRVSDLNGKYWKRHYLAAKRVLPETLASADLPSSHRFE
ncbi:Murein DD-endopeptidase MepH [compost metagenome]|uniref:Cell wall-associated hydrolase, NlpC family n=1 Tax=Pseudomonas jinjuensis TaxID=198616 RepID=A0A1H0AC77_9PSED|nr:Cell wall-associated hydrolase, NlpC family [Pseudomonas jinjuensis]